MYSNSDGISLKIKFSLLLERDRGIKKSVQKLSGVKSKQDNEQTNNIAGMFVWVMKYDTKGIKVMKK